jgi:hypothetical protein
MAGTASVLEVEERKRIPSRSDYLPQRRRKKEFTTKDTKITKGSRNGPGNLPLVILVSFVVNPSFLGVSAVQ